MVRNALSVDVEDWFQVGAFENVIDRNNWDALECRVEANTDKILMMFDAAGVKGTFFTLGWIAERYPALIRQIVAQGHEVASHGWDHSRVFNMTAEQFSHDISRNLRVRVMPIRQA
jgi:polysaccharide deacetylase family protein (PEP-CTERM system associated)